jgi:hypothetical protein
MFRGLAMSARVAGDYRDNEKAEKHVCMLLLFQERRISSQKGILLH